MWVKQVFKSTSPQNTPALEDCRLIIVSLELELELHDIPLLFLSAAKLSTGVVFTTACKFEIHLRELYNAYHILTLNIRMFQLSENKFKNT